jgi:hypothetical protein
LPENSAGITTDPKPSSRNTPAVDEESRVLEWLVNADPWADTALIHIHKVLYAERKPNRLLAKDDLDRGELSPSDPVPIPGWPLERTISERRDGGDSGKC